MHLFRKNLIYCNKLTLLITFQYVIGTRNAYVSNKLKIVPHMYGDSYVLFPSFNFVALISWQIQPIEPFDCRVHHSECKSIGCSAFTSIELQLFFILLY